MQHVNNAPPPLPQPLSHLQPLLDKMTAKDPQDRFPHATSLLETAQEVRDSGVQHAASMTANSSALRVLALPRAVRPEPPARLEACEPDVPPLVAGSALEKTLILPEPEESTMAGETWMSGPPSAGVTPTARRLTPANIWLLTGAAVVLALAVMMGTGSLAGFKKTAVPATVFPSAPRLAADAAPKMPAAQTAPPAVAASAVEAVLPAAVAQPVLSTGALPAAQFGQPAESVQALDLTPLTDAEQPAAGHPATDVVSSEDEAPPVPSVTPPTSTVQAQVEALLSAAQAALADNRLTSPADDNAAYYYQQVRQLDPTHSQATQGQRLIADRYYVLAQQSMQKGQSTRAKQHLQTGLGVQNDHPGLLALHDSLQKDETQRERPLQTTPAQPPQRMAQPRPRSAASARRVEPSARGLHRSEKGVFSGVKDFFKASPGRQPFPPDEKSSMNDKN